MNKYEILFNQDLDGFPNTIKFSIDDTDLEAAIKNAKSALSRPQDWELIRAELSMGPRMYQDNGKAGKGVRTCRGKPFMTMLDKDLTGFTEIERGE